LIGGLILGAVACSTDLTEPHGPPAGAKFGAANLNVVAASAAWGSSTEGTGTSNPTTVSFTPPTGTRGIVVWITQPIVNTDILTGVTIDGVDTKRVGSYANTTVNGGRVYCYFLGSDLPSGTVTIAVGRSQSTTTLHVVAEAITGDADTEVIDFAGQAGFIGNPRLTLQSSGRTAIGLTAMYSSIDNVLSSAAEAAGQQRVQDHDFGTETSLESRVSSPGTSNVAMGWNMNSGQIAHMAVLVSEVGGTPPPDTVPTDTMPTDTTPPDPDVVTLIGAGDVHAKCDAGHNSAKTAALIADEPKSTRVFTIGDNAGINGSAAEYQCYDGKWGQFQSRTLLAMGNHERRIDPTAKAYYDYGNGVGVDSGAVGRRGKGYYAVTYGDWRILVLNSEQALTEQVDWIRRDLAAHPKLCQLAIWHKPMFNSGTSVKSVTTVRPLWQSLYDKGADVILNAHDHTYQRNAKVDPSGARDDSGIRQFIVGTGGGVAGGLASPRLAINEKAVIAWGVLKLKLYSTRYEWQFIDINGVVRDSGGDDCHS